MGSYVYINPSMNGVGSFDSVQLEEFTERHHFRMPLVLLEPAASLQREIMSRSAVGVVFSLDAGLPGWRQLGLIRRALKRRLTVYLHWPAEQAIEVVDFERWRSLWRHWIAYAAATRLRRSAEQRIASAAAALAPTANDEAPVLGPSTERVAFLAADYAGMSAHMIAGITDVEWVANSLAEIVDRAVESETEVSADQLLEQLIPLRQAIGRIRLYLTDGRTALERIGGIIDDLHAEVSDRAIGLSGAAGSGVPPAVRAPPLIEDYARLLGEFAGDTDPVGFAPGTPLPTPERKLAGTGVYLRLDYWSQLISGGSYGHTCYVAQELARVSEDFVCLMGSRFPLLDELSIRQEIFHPPTVTQNEIDLLAADAYYYEALKDRLKKIKPAYIYERTVLGNYAGARLSRELGIPYIVEYNGSEIAMRHSFSAGSLDHEALFIEAERISFMQATAIAAISQHVRDDVLARGVDPHKILVNPNGVNCEEYAPADAKERHELRSSLGLSDDAFVIGFIGTFGGWHGIDVIAAALPEICRRDKNVRFLLIGDGNLKHLVLEAISKNSLQPQIVDVGRTEQRLGGRLLKAADIYISPHSSHMRDSPFFGSPTKLFEYMAMGGGIVASDLEQLGEVLTPALQPADFTKGDVTVEQERAVLCRPGDVGEFVDGVMGLVNHPEVAAALGRNARAAALEHFSWRSHVARTWRHTLGFGADDSWRAPRRAGKSG